jgi:hypothetical protein
VTSANVPFPGALVLVAQPHLGGHVVERGRSPVRHQAVAEHAVVTAPAHEQIEIAVTLEIDERRHGHRVELREARGRGHVFEFGQTVAVAVAQVAVQATAQATAQARPVRAKPRRAEPMSVRIDAIRASYCERSTETLPRLSIATSARPSPSKSLTVSAPSGVPTK